MASGEQIVLPFPTYRWTKESDPVNLNFIFAVMCITVIGSVAMLLGFCYRQEILKTLFHSKTKIKDKEISSEVTLGIDKKDMR